MATYKIEGPDGKLYNLDGPSGLSAYDLNLLKQGYFGAPPAPAPVAPPPPGETGFFPSVMRGGRGIYSLLGDVVPAMAAKAVGAEDYAKRQMQEAAEYEKETQRLYPAEVASYKDIKDVGTFLTYVKESIGEAIPSIIPSIFTGGAAAVIGRPAIAAAQKAGSDLARREMLEAVTKGTLTKEIRDDIKDRAIKAGVEAGRREAAKYEAMGAVAGSAAQNVPEVYQNIAEAAGEGKLPDLAPALVAGGFNAVLDAITPLRILQVSKARGIPNQEIIGAWYKRAGKGALEGFITEGGTEALQEMSSAAAEKFVNNNKNFFTPENFERFINAGLKGGFGGAGITAATHVAAGRAEEKEPLPTPEKEITETTEPPPKGEPSVRPTVAAPSGAGFRILEEPVSEQAAPGARAPEQPGVVSPVKDVGQPAAGERTQPVAIAKTTEPTAPASTSTAAPAVSETGEITKPYSEWMKERKTEAPPPGPSIQERLDKARPSTAEIKKEIKQTKQQAGVLYDEERSTHRLADSDAARLLDASIKGELPEDLPLGSARLRSVVERVARGIEVPESDASPEDRAKFFKELSARLESTRQDLPQWSDLREDAKDYYLSYVREDTPENRAVARDQLYSYINKLSETQDRTRSQLLAEPEARVYESNRDNYKKLEQVDYPAWDKLTNEQREMFRTSLRAISPDQDVLKSAAPQHDTVFKRLGDALKVEQAARTAEEKAKKQAVPPGYERSQAEIQAKEEQKIAEKTAEEGPRVEPTPGVEPKFGESATPLEPKGVPEIKIRDPLLVSPEAEEFVKAGNTQAVLQYLRTKAKSKVSKILAQSLFELNLKTKIEYVDSLPDNNFAQYDPKTDTISVTENGLTQSTLLHEFVHAATVKVLNRYLTQNGRGLTLDQKEAVEQILEVMDEAKLNLGGAYPEAFTNPYEFLSHAMTDKVFQKSLAALPTENIVFTGLPSTKNAWSKFMKALAELFPRIKELFKSGKAGTEDTNALAELFRAYEQIISVPEGGIDLAPLPTGEVKTADPLPSDRSDEEILNDARKQTELKEHGVKPFIKTLMTNRGFNWFVTKFQNERYYVKLPTDLAQKRGILKRTTDLVNDVYGQITRSTGIAVDLYHTHIKGLTQDVHSAIEAYAKATGQDTKTALADLHLIFEARHEPERRLVKYILKVPLDEDKKIIEFNGQTYSAAGFREEILKQLSVPMPELSEAQRKARAQDFRQMLNAVAFDSRFHPALTKQMDSKGRVKATKTSPSDFDPNSETYNVIANRSPYEINRIQKMLDTKQNKEQIDAIAKALKNLQDESVRLNRIANYWSEPVQNIVDFYGYENYVPFKGRVGGRLIDDELNLDSKNLGGDLQEMQDTFEGRKSESENPLLQTIADGATAAMRAGRKDLTLAIKNAIKDGIIAGKVKTGAIKFEDRYLRGETKKELGGINKVFHYNQDGTIDVLELTNDRQREAIRRNYRTSQPLLDIANSATSLLGQTHTRYNPAFGPMNFIRDAFTNAFIVSAEMGPQRGGKLITAIASDVSSGGLYRALNFSRLYANGEMKEIERLAGGQKPYDSLDSQERAYRDISDYIKLGGRVSYLQGIAAKGVLDELVKEVGKTGVLRTKEQIDKFFDAYNDIFELSSRVSTYRMLKEEFRADGESEQEARAHAVEYSKNLANFEQVGQWGKAAGALFMFFRPAATGAVRAIESLRPALGFDEAVFREQNKNMPQEQLDRAVAQMIKERDTARAVSMGILGAGVVMYMLAMAMSGDDDQKRNRVATDDMARWTRYARIFVPGFENPIQIPWGFGPGAFGAAGAQIAGFIMGRSSFGDMATNIMTIGLDSFLPLPFSRISPLDNFPAFAMDSITPSAFRPFFEYVMNLDGLGREIYNNRQSRYGDAYTGGDNIPEMYKMAARKLFDITQGAVDWSPNTMYFFASNYADGLAKALSASLNVGLTVTGQKDFDPKNDILLLSSFVGTKSNVDAREFSKAEKEIKEYDKRINALKTQPDLLLQFVKSNPEKYEMVQYYNQAVNGQLRQLRQVANQVRVDKDISIAERKAKIEQIVNMENVIKRKILDDFEFIEKSRR